MKIFKFFSKFTEVTQSLNVFIYSRDGETYAVSIGESFNESILLFSGNRSDAYKFASDHFR